MVNRKFIYRDVEEDVASECLLADDWRENWRND